MRILVVSFDRLPASSLGCYGATFVPTPHFDALAGGGLVCENYFLSRTGESLLNNLRDLGEPMLLIQEMEPGSHVSLPHVPHAVVNGLPRLSREELDRTVATWLQSSPARLLGIDDRPRLVSPAALHSAVGCWTDLLTDACPDDSESPAWLTFADVQAQLERVPDSLRPLIEHTARVIEQDRFLGQLLTSLQHHVEDELLLIATASEGDPHACREERPDWLMSVSEPIAHLPLLIWRSNPLLEQETGERCDALLQPGDVARFITAILGHGMTDLADLANFLQLSGHEEIRYSSPLATAMRNQDWLAIRRDPQSAASGVAVEAEESVVQLFRKPEDAWEILDVATQFPALIERVQTAGQLSE